LAEKKSQDFHIWILAILSAREENARRLPHLDTCNFVCQRRKCKKTSTFGYLQFCLPEKKVKEDFHIWILAILSAREENARRLPHLVTCIFVSQRRKCKKTSTFGNF
jgi:hypothetical protein